VGQSDGKRQLGRPRHKLEERQDAVLWSGFIWLRIGTSGGGTCEHGNEPSGSIKSWIILE
jgi:hypothetical protein